MAADTIVVVLLVMDKHEDGGEDQRVAWGGSEGGMTTKNAVLYTLYKSFKSKSYRKIFAPGLVFLTIPSFPFASPNM
jgi:hypothetical protein